MARLRRFRASLLLVRERVAVGEESGTLDAVLDQLAEFSERYQQFKDKVITSLIYPLLVLTMSMGVGMFLMTVVVPMLLDNLLSAGQPLPWPTRVLKGDERHDSRARLVDRAAGRGGGRGGGGGAADRAGAACVARVAGAA